MKSDFNSQGYVLVKDLLQKEVINEILLDIHSIFKHKFESDNFHYNNQPNGLITSEDLVRYYSFNKEGYIGCMRIAQKIPIFFQLASSKKILDLIKDLGLKHPVISQEPILMLNNQKTSRATGDWKTPLHQDWRSRQGSLNSVTMWIGLVDVTPELGPVEIIPGSHLKGLLPIDDDEWFSHVKKDYVNEGEFVSMPVKAGDAVIFSHFLLHQSGTNKTNNFRYSLQFRYDDVLDPTFMHRNYPNSRSSLSTKELITPNFPSLKEIENTFKN